MRGPLGGCSAPAVVSTGRHDDSSAGWLVLTAFAAVGYVATAWLHSTGYGSVTELAGQAPADLASLVPALWVMFSLDLVILGLIVALIAWRPSATGRVILVIAALSPFGLTVRWTAPNP